MTKGSADENQNAEQAAQNDVKLTPSDGDQKNAKEEKVEITRTNPNKAVENKPAQSSTGKNKDQDQGYGNDLVALQQFLKETYQEFKKISWPSRQQVLQETWSVLVLCTVITVMVLGFDYAVSRAIFEPLDKLARKIGGGMGSHSRHVTMPDDQPVPIMPTAPVPAPGSTAPAPGSTAPTPGSAAPTPGSANPAPDSAAPIAPPAQTPAPAQNSSPTSKTDSPPGKQ